MSDEEAQWILARIDEGIVFEPGMAFSVELWPGLSGDGPTQLHIDRYVEEGSRQFDVRSVAETKARLKEAGMSDAKAELLAQKLWAQREH
jgi:hypothetical protein